MNLSTCQKVFLSLQERVNSVLKSTYLLYIIWIKLPTVFEINRDMQRPVKET